MTANVDLKAISTEISRVAGLKQKPLLKEVSRWKEFEVSKKEPSALPSQLTALVTTDGLQFPESQERTLLKLDLKMLAGNLETLGLEKDSAVTRTLESIQQLLQRIALAKPNTQLITTKLTKEAVKRANFDESVTRAYWKQEEITCVDRRLVFSDKLRALVDDNMLANIIKHSDPNVLKEVTTFDFSHFPKLTHKAPGLIARFFPNIDRFSFTCLEERKFCDRELTVRGKSIWVNMEFLAYHSPFFASIDQEKLDKQDPDKVQNFIDFLIGKLALKDFKDIPKLFEVMGQATVFEAESVLHMALLQLDATLLANRETMEYIHFASINRDLKAGPIIANIDKVNWLLSFYAASALILKAESSLRPNLALLTRELETVSKIADFPKIPDITDLLDLQRAVVDLQRDVTRHDLPFPVELDTLLTTISRHFPEDKMAFYLLGRLHFLEWNDKQQDLAKVREYYTQVPGSFFLDKGLLSGHTGGII